MWNDKYNNASKIFGCKLLWADPAHIVGLFITEDFSKSKYWIEDQYELIKDVFHNEDIILWKSCSYNYEYYKFGNEFMNMMYEEDYKLYFPKEECKPFIMMGDKLTLVIAPRCGNNSLPEWLEGVFDWGSE